MKRNNVRPRVTYDGAASRIARIASRPGIQPRRAAVLVVWLSGLCAVLAMPANAADAETDAKIKALEAQVEALSTQIQDLKVGTASKYAETQKQITAVAPTIDQRSSHADIGGWRVLGVVALARSVRHGLLRSVGPAAGPSTVERLQLPPRAPRHRRQGVHRLGIQLHLRLRRQRRRRFIDLRRIRAVQRLESGAAQAGCVRAVREHRRQRGIVGPAVPRARDGIGDSAGSGGRRRSFGIQRGASGRAVLRVAGVYRWPREPVQHSRRAAGIARPRSLSRDVLSGFQDRSRNERHVDLLSRRRQSAARRCAEPWATLPNCAWTTPARTARRPT